MLGLCHRVEGREAEVQSIEEELGHLAVGAVSGQIPWGKSSSVLCDDDIHVRLVDQQQQECVGRMCISEFDHRRCSRYCR